MASSGQDANDAIYKPSPFMKAAAQIIEASEGRLPDDLNWHPLTSGEGHEASDAIELPAELMMNLVGPGLAAVRGARPPPPAAPLAPSQERARKRLQQRKEAAAREAAEKAAQEKQDEEPLDESWIDQMEQKNAKKKAGKEKAAQIRKERNERKKAKKKAEVVATQAVEAAKEEQEKEEEEEEEVKQEVEVEVEATAAKQVAVEAAEEEEEKEEEVEVEVEVEAEAVEATEEQEKEEEEVKPEVEVEVEAEAKKKADVVVKQEAVEAVEEEEEEEEEVKQEVQVEVEEPEETARAIEETEDILEAVALFEKEEAIAQREAEKSRRGTRERRSQAKDEPQDLRPADAMRQSRCVLQETGEQPLQAKSLRQTLTPSQLRRQQRKRQKEARRAAEAAAREENRSDKEESDEKCEEKPKPLERKQPERQSKQRERTHSEIKRAQAEKTPPEDKADTKKNIKEEAKTPARSENPHSAEAKTAPSVNPSDAKELEQEKQEPSSLSTDLRPPAPTSDAEAFTVPGSNQAFGRRRRQEQDQNLMQPMMPITTLMISQLREHMDGPSLRRQLDAWGFVGTYNFFYMPPEAAEGWGGRCAFLNFEDQGVASMCLSYFQNCPSEGVAQPYNIQGLDNLVAHFSQFVGAGDMVNGPLIVPTPTPAAWAINGAQAVMNAPPSGKFSPQIRGQFHKTKMCAFHKKKKCTMGVGCPFAHSREELNIAPDLSKTKLCVNFFRKKCNDANCKFAHGHSELRATGGVYKTELCRAWTAGSCKAGDTCRYAHGVKELRGGGMSSMTATAMGYMGYSMDEDYMAIDGVQMGCDVMGGLTGIWENEAAAMQHYSNFGAVPSAGAVPSQSSGDRQRAGRAFSGQPQDGTSEPCSDTMSDFGFSDTSTLCQGDGRLSRQQTAPPTASFPAEVLSAGYELKRKVVLRVKGTFMESVFLDEEVEKMPMRRSWSDGDLPQFQDVDGEQDL